MAEKNKIKIGIVQAAPKLFDLETTLAKVNEWLSIASKEKCDFVLFPESFIPGYPRYITFDAVVGKRTDKSRSEWLQYWNSSVEIGSTEEARLSEVIKEHSIPIAIGVTERERIGGSLYCSFLYYDRKGKLLGNHRKLKPTGLERYVWAEGDGSGLVTFDTQFGILGGLICWENFMPEARMSMYQKGVHIYLAPTADMRDSWESLIRTIALEGRCFVLSANQFVHRTDYPDEFVKYLNPDDDIVSRGGSAVVGPDGNFIIGPVYDKEELLIADIDLEEVEKHKLDFDVAGHYSRKDVFQNSVAGMPETKKVIL